MTSEAPPQEAYVWIWPQGGLAPVVAGRVFREGDRLSFIYGQSYLQREGAIALFPPELPLHTGPIDPLPGLSIPGCLRDGSPDAWGRRVIINRRFGQRRNDVDLDSLDELSFMLESGSDRVGALDFQRSASHYEPRLATSASLAELMSAADRVQAGEPLSAELELALYHGSSLGGARPKAMIIDGERKYIAKFSASSDITNVVKAEYVAMRLAAAVGLDVAPVTLRRVADRDVLLIERFDRVAHAGGWVRRGMVSALTMLGLDEMMARYASYEVLAEIIRHRFIDPSATLRELFGRMVFNVLCGNTDDHARNHAAFWNGSTLQLTPAYDICPQNRAGEEATQAMLIIGNDRMSRLAVCLRAAPAFLLDTAAAKALIDAQVTLVRQHWKSVCDEAAMTTVERNLPWQRQFLNPFAFVGWAG